MACTLHDRGRGEGTVPRLLTRDPALQLTNAYCSGEEKGFNLRSSVSVAHRSPEHAGKRRHQDPIGQASETVEKLQGSCLETHSAF